MDTALDYRQLTSSLEGANNILIFLSTNPSLDMVASGLALYLVFKKINKNATIACPTAMTVAFNRLIGVDKITDKIGSRNLVISFDYIKDSIEKVSYNIEDNKFNLVVEPKDNFPPLDSNKVTYSQSGAAADLIFVIGCNRLEDLEKFYFEEKKIFEDKLTVNLDFKTTNTRFGKVNLLDNKATSCSEIVVSLFKNLNLPADADITTNLFAGIKTNSANFQSANVSALSFEAAAWCLSNGARQNHLTGGTSPPFTPFQTGVIPPFSKISKPVDSNATPPPDWFKPKIYQGKTQI